MIIYKRKKKQLVIPCGLGPVVCENTNYELQMKQVDSSTVTQNVEPDEGIYGLYRVIVNPYTLESKADTLTENGQYVYTADNADALSQVTIDVSIDTVNNQSKTVNSSTSSQTVTPDEGYTGLDEVTVNPYTLETKSQVITVNGEYVISPSEADGLSSVDISVNIADTPAIVQEKTADSSTVSQTVTPDDGYDGLSSVTINPYTLDDKTVDSSTVSQTVISDEDGLSSVTINPYTVESKSDTLTSNGQYVFTPDNADALSQVTVDVSINTVNNQSKTVNSSTSSQTVSPDQGYTGLDTVTVNPYVLDSKTVNSSTSSQTVVSDEDGLSSVTVNPYTVESQSETLTANGQYVFTPDNADALSQVTVDVSINTVNNQSKSVNSSTDMQYVVPDQGYTGLDYVAVNPYTLDSKTVNSSTSSQTVVSDEDGLSSVTVNPYTVESKSDTLTANGQYVFTPDNADALSQVTVDVSINTVNNQSKTADSSTSSQIITPDNGYTGLSDVTINPYVLDSKTVDSSTVLQVITSDEDGLSSVTVNPYTLALQEKEITFNSCYTYDPRTYVPPLEYNRFEITADASYDGLSSAKFCVVPDIIDLYGMADHFELRQLPGTEPRIIRVDFSGLGVNDPTSYLNIEKYVKAINLWSVILQDKAVNPSTNEQVITCDPYDASLLTAWARSGDTSVDYLQERYQGLNKVIINPVTADIDPDIQPENIKVGVEILGVIGSYAGQQINNQSKTVNSSTSSQVITPDNGYTGLSNVTVNPYVLDTKTVDSSTVQQVITSDEDGLSSVTVNPYTINNQDKEFTIVDITDETSVITPDASYDGLSSVSLKKVDGYLDIRTQGRGEYEINVNRYLDVVRVYDLMLQDNRVADPSTSIQVIYPEIRPEPWQAGADVSYDGLWNVTINPVTAAIDPDIQPENIKVGVEILGVIGSYAGQQINNQSKTANSSTSSQVITPDNGYTGLSNVTINPYVLDTKTVDSSTVSQTIVSDEDGLSSVTVNPYTVESDSSTLTANGQYVFTPTNADALSQVTVDVSINTVNNQNKTVNSSTNSQSITADSGYTGLGTVTVNPYVLDSKTVDASTVSQTIVSDEDGLSSVTVNPYTTTALTVDASRASITYEPSTADAFSQVTVNAAVLQNRRVDASTVELDISRTSTSLYYGLQHVYINPVTASIDDNIQAGNIKDGVTILGVTGTFEGGTLGTKTVNSSTSSQTVTPDSGDYGLSSVTVNPYTLDSKTVDCSTGQQVITSDVDGLSSVTVNAANLQSRTVDPSTAQVRYYPTTTGAIGLSSIVVRAVTSSIDSNIQAGNIKNGVTILGVTGNYQGGTLGTKTVNSSTSSQTVTPDSGDYGLSSVTINPYTLDSKTVDCSTGQQVITSDADGLSSVTVNAASLQGRTYTPSTTTQTIYPNSSYIGFRSVTINGVTSSIDANIQSGNIKNGVSILGVTGTFEGDIDYDSIYNALIQI